MSPREILDSLRIRAGVSVTGLGPSVGMSSAWGQRVLDGTICPGIGHADKLAAVLCARATERRALLTAVARIQLGRTGLREESLDALVVLLVKYIEQRGI